MRPDVDGDQTIGKVSKPALEVWSPLSYCPRSSLPADVLAWLAGRLTRLPPPRPPGQGGTPPLALEVRLDAVAAVILDGLSYRRAARMVGISKTEVGDSMDLLLPKLAELGYCQPDGTFVTTLAELRELLEEMAHTGKAVVVDGLGTRVQRPSGWGNQKVLYDPKRHTHTPRAWRYRPSGATCCGATGAGRAAATSRSSSSCRGLTGCWTPPAWSVCWTGGFGAWPSRVSTGTRRSGTAAPSTGSATRNAPTTVARRGCARWWSSRSGTWPTPGRCAAGADCCTASRTSSAPPACSSASAAGCTGFPHDTSITDTLSMKRGRSSSGGTGLVR